MKYCFLNVSLLLLYTGNVSGELRLFLFVRNVNLKSIDE